jgi:pimeloyl-ACP methyl ester carboxylesterase
MTRNRRKVLALAGGAFATVLLLIAAVYVRVSSSGTPLGLSKDPFVSMKEVPCTVNYGGGRCGVVTAPLDYQGRETGIVRVGFVYYPAAGLFTDKGRVAQLVSGGPGLSMSSYMANPLIAYVTRFKFQSTAILVIDARGVGRSTRLTCPQASENKGADVVINPEVVAACAEEAGSTRVHYNTENAVRDFNLVKRALGIEKIDLVGLSYGTNSAVMYATLFPNEVRSLILDGAFTIKNASPVLAESFAAINRQFAAGCNESKKCTPESATIALDKVVSELRNAPRPLTVPNRGFGDSNSPMLDTGQLAMMTRYLPGSLGDKHYFPLLGAVLDASKGDWQKLERLAVLYNLFFRDPALSASNDGAEYSLAMGRAVDCGELDLAWDPNADIPARKVQFAKTLAEADARNAVKPFKAEEWISSQDPRVGCLFYPAPPRGYEAVKRYAKLDQLPPSLPILIMSGDLDMNAPLESAQSLAAILKSAQFARFRYNEHIVIPANSCGFDMALEFLDELRIEDPSRCQNKGQLSIDIFSIPPIMVKYLAGEPIT